MRLRATRLLSRIKIQLIGGISGVCSVILEGRLSAVRIGYASCLGAMFSL